MTASGKKVNPDNFLDFYHQPSDLLAGKNLPHLRCRSSPRSRSALARAAAAFSASETPPGSPPSPFPWQTPWRMV